MRLQAIELKKRVNTMSAFSDVLSSPRPRLDENSVREQLGSYQQALKLLYHTDLTTVFTVPAGAGSGKTRTLVATIVGLLRLGVEPDLIESISFTNASADDLQSKLIKNLAELSLQDFESVKVSNLGFSTIHKHAIDLLKKLEPHVGGVAYYFEDAGVSTSVGASDGADAVALEKATKLALYASIVYSGSDTSLYQALRPIIEHDSTNRFILSNIRTEDQFELAHEFIRKEAMSDAGLGAFTNIDDTDPNYCIAVATDSLLRLSLKTGNVAIEEKRQRFGLPAIMMVDEAQDLDLIQLLYLRALALNGVSIMMVGDPRQTLFEFRNSVSEWPFLEGFMEALFHGTSIRTVISSSPLETNYRCRAEIVDVAEGVSEAMVSASVDHKSKKIERIIDPRSVRRSHHFISDDEAVNTDKNAPAVRFFVGDKTADIDFLMPRGPAKNAVSSSNPMSRLSQRLEQKEEGALSEEKMKALKRKVGQLQIPSLCGGDNQSEIESAIQDLYERSRHGESVAILTRNGLKSGDLRYLRSVLGKKYSGIENPTSLRINQINAEKNAPLSAYWFLGADEEAHNEIPFSSLMIGAALHYNLSWDRLASDELRLHGMKEFSNVVPASSIVEAEKANAKAQPDESISVELEPYVSALVANASDFFPMSTQRDVVANEKELTALLTRFVKDVLMRYSVLMWENFQGKVFSRQPCRFQGMAIMRNKVRGLPQLRPLMETKRFFKIYWEAVVSTPFQLSGADRALLSRLGMNVEWLSQSTSLINFSEELAIFKEKAGLKGHMLRSDVVSRLEEFVHVRGTVHEQFSKLYHHKIRTYLREVAKQVGRLIRLDPASDQDFVMIAAYEHFRSARQKARVNTWAKENKSKLNYMGLFDDLRNGMRDIQVKSKPKPKGEDSQLGSIPTINFTTIHSSKGLEWDHVLLFFPPGTSDTKSSFKSVRDLLYVAFTRAARTLTVVIPKDKNYKKDSPTNSPMVVARHVISEYAREHDLFNRKIEFNSLLEDKSEQCEGEETVEVELQTSHSELEKALSCRMHHHIQHNRNLSSMVPITSPSYSFFFHTAMSSICAGLIGQRLPIPEDPVAEIVRVIDGMAVQKDLTEERVYDALMSGAENQINDLMSSMIPMYFLSGGKRYFEVMSYYSQNFASQLASLAVGSKLFQNLLTAKLVPGHKIWIEKPVKDVMSLEDDRLFLPVMGIPDIKIAGPTVNYVCDYKTVPCPSDPSGDFSEEEMLLISEKTSVQINLYQGLVNRQQDAERSAEVIYVPDITLFEGDDIPVESPQLPSFNNNAYYKVRSHLRDAVVLTTDHFDHDLFEETKESISNLRIQAANNLEHSPSSLFSPTPLIGDNCTVEVAYDTCRSCPSAVHCHKRKKSEMEGALA